VQPAGKRVCYVKSCFTCVLGVKSVCLDEKWQTMGFCSQQHAYFAFNDAYKISPDFLWNVLLPQNNEPFIVDRTV